MKKTLKRLLLSLCLIFCLSTISITLISCGEKPTPSEEKPADPFANLVFEDATFDYDGKEHSIVVTGTIPEGMEIKYRNNAQTYPGEYEARASIRYEGKVINKFAVLKINALKSELSVKDNQVGYVGDEVVFPEYTLNNDEQELNYILKRDGVLVENDCINRAGNYELEIYAPASKIYSESNHITVKYTVKESQFDISYPNTTITHDGKSHALELTGTLPAGYTVEYAGNEGTNVGKYFCTANIKNASGDIVETHRAVLKIVNSDNAAFEAYLDQFLVDFFTGSQLDVNIFFEHPENFGLERYEASWYTYSGYTDAEMQEIIQSYTDEIAKLKEFENQDLSPRQLLAYQQILDQLVYQKNFYSIPDVIYMSNYYIDQFGGYVADFGTYMEAYTMRSAADVQDIVDFITSTKEAFNSYLVYLDDKTKAGYPLSDTTLDAMIKYLDDLLKTVEKDGHYYLEPVLNEKIDALDFLNDADKTSFKQKIAKALDDYFIVGVQDLKDGLKDYYHKLDKKDEGYLASYEHGQELFELKLRDLLGFDSMDMDAYMKELLAQYKSTSALSEEKLNYLLKKYNIQTEGDLDRLMQSVTICPGTPEEQLVFLKEFAKTIVPSLEVTPEIVVKTMDEASAKVSNAVAYYMKSAVDNTEKEYITLNPVQAVESNEVLGTLSHEGYPGHLYAYLYSKELDLHTISKVLTSTAHGEGWATYVEVKLYEYAIKTAKDAKTREIAEYLYAEQISGYTIYAYIDAGIHYAHWSVDELAEVMGGFGLNSSAAQDIYNLLIETPVSYAAYGYGKIFMMNLHDQARKALGKYYDEVEFNSIILSKGWTSLQILQQTCSDYIAETEFRYGLNSK